MSEPFITVYTIDGRANKLVTRRKGKVCKEGGSPFSKAVASSFRVDTAEMLADLLRAVGDQENSVISLGYIPGTEPTGDTSQGSPYTVLSEKNWLRNSVSIRMITMPLPGWSCHGLVPDT